MKYLSSLTQNPIILYAMRGRRRNWRTNTALFLALATYVPCCLVFGLGALSSLVLASGVQDFLRDLDNAGQITFYITAVLLLIFVTLFAPMMALSAIAGEKQRQTLDLLRVTLLPERKIVGGKLISALLYSLLLIVLAWPVILFCLITGGVKIMELIVLVVLLLTTAVAFTSVGLFMSSLSRSTTNAAMLTYGVALPLLLLGPFLAMLPISIASSFADSYQIGELVNFYGWSLAASLNPIISAILSAVWHTDKGGWLVYNWSIASRHHYLPFPWIIYAVFYSLLTWLLTQLTTRRLERMNE